MREGLDSNTPKKNSSARPASDFGTEPDPDQLLSSPRHTDMGADLSQQSGTARGLIISEVQARLFTPLYLDETRDADKLKEFKQRNPDWLPGDPLFLREGLNVDPEKIAAAALLTVQPTRAENYAVWNGQPSQNGTRIEVNGTHIPIIEAVSIKAGDTIHIGASKVTIPDSLENITTDLEFDILQLEVGEAMIVGRIFYKGFPKYQDYDAHLLNSTVSRQHCTLIRAEDAIDTDGTAHRIYQVVDGVKGDKKLFVDTSDGSWEEFDGRVILGSGRQIKIGEDGPVIEVPDPFKHFDYSQHIAGAADHVSEQSVVACIDDFTASQGGFGKQSLSFRAPEDMMLRSRTVRPQQAQFLGNHVKQGLDLIKEGNYTAARKHFEQAEVLTACGFRLEPGNWFGCITPEVTGKIAFRLLQDIASRSWFKPDSKVVSPSFGFIEKGDPALGFQRFDREAVDLSNRESVQEMRLSMSVSISQATSPFGIEQHRYPLTEKEKDILANFEREVCLIYAEEWTHAYQHALGTLVSKKGVLMENLPRELRGEPLHEYDVRELFGERGVPMSPMFKSRYSREDAHRALDNYASKSEQAAIRSLLALANVGDGIVIGRDAGTSGGNANYNITDVGTADLERSLAERRAMYIEQQISPEHLLVTPLGAGLYEIEPLRPSRSDGKVFFRDDYGIWRNITGAKDLKAGTRVRAGIAFEFKLP